MITPEVAIKSWEPNSKIKIQNVFLSSGVEQTVNKLFLNIDRSMRNFLWVDILITRFLAKMGIKFLRWSIGIIFIWFGALKFFPGVSPAQDLATSTINLLTFDLISLQVSLILLATLEVSIGILLVAGKWMRFTLFLLLFQMGGTMSPIFLFPDLVFTQFPYALTMEGQYIFKNFVVISAAIVIGATVRGGQLTSEPDKKY